MRLFRLRNRRFMLDIMPLYGRPIVSALDTIGLPYSPVAMTYLDYARRGKNAFWRYLVTVLLAFVFAMVFIFALMLPPIALHWVPKSIGIDMQSPAHPLAFYGGLVLTFGTLLAGLIGAAALIHKKNAGDIIGNWRWHLSALGAAGWFGFTLLGLAIDYALRPKGFSLTLGNLTPVVIVSAIIGIAVQTFAEEFIFRGYVTQGLLLATKRPWVAAILSGLIFGSVHIPNGWPQAANAVVFGVVMSLVAIRTGSLALSYGVHFINNLIGAIGIVSADDVFRGTPGILTQHTPDLLWLDTAVGAAGLIVLLVIVLKFTPKPDGSTAIAADQYPK